MSARDLPPGLMIMSDGRVQGRSGTWLKQPLNAQGYPCIGVRIEGRVKTYTVHFLVCRAFHGRPPSPRHEVAHLNGIRTDNRAANLAWKTRAENEADKLAHGTYGKRLTADQVRAVRAAFAAGGRVTELAARFSISKSHVSAIVNRKVWKELDRDAA